VLVWLALVVLGVGGGVVSWLVTRWRVAGNALQVETGVLRRQSIRIPLARVQAVDVVAPLLARVFGLAEVRVVSAGRGAERGRLAYLAVTDAQALRAQLLALAHGLAAHTPEPAAVAVFRLDNLELAAGFCLRAQVLAPLVLSAVFLGVSVGLHDAPSFGGAVTSVVGTTVAVARAFNEEYDLSLDEAGDGLRVDRGLLQRRHETIPYGRVQAVRLLEPLLWRPFGWARLEIDIARQAARREDEQPRQLLRTLVPVARREVALAVMGRVMPASSPTPPPGAQPPRRAVLRAPLSYHFLAAWEDGYHVCSRIGRVRAETVVVPLAKIQSLRLVSGPLQRALRLASLHVDTAGHRWAASAIMRDAGDADSRLWRLAQTARTARRRTARGDVLLAPGPAS
jgi:putative membrane protein